MRPCKDTIDYFPHYTTHGKTMFAIENAFGNDGYAAWFKLLEILGRHPGHYYDMRKPIDKHYLSAYLRLDARKTDEVLQMLADVDAIDADLYKDGILWSQNFTKHLMPLYKRRNSVPPQKPVIVDINGVSDDNNPVNVVNNTQSKVKESKGKESKKTYGTFDNVLLSDVEIGKLRDRFSDSCDDRINALSEYMRSKGRRYKDHYATILAWDRKDKKQDDCGSIDYAAGAI